MELVDTPLGGSIEIGLYDGEVDQAGEGAPRSTRGPLLDLDRPDGSFGHIVRKRDGQVGSEPKDHVLEPFEPFEPFEPADQGTGIDGQLTAGVPVVIASSGQGTVVVVADFAQGSRVQDIGAGFAGYPCRV